MQCPYHCTSGWLPDRGGTDSITNDDGSVLLLLHPSEFVGCFHCNEAMWTNDDIEED